MSDKDLDEIDSQADSSVPYYVPTLTREVRSLRARLLTLEQALRDLIANDEVQLALGGNPNVTARVIAQARAALAASRGREPERTWPIGDYAGRRRSPQPMEPEDR